MPSRVPISNIIHHDNTIGRTHRIPRLDKDGARASELADEALCRRQTRDDTTRCHPFHDILGIPGDEVAIVNDVLLSIDKLIAVSIP